MGRKKEFKVAKSFTITVKNVAWLEEQCYETGEKASVILERLISKERQGYGKSMTIINFIVLNARVNKQY